MLALSVLALLVESISVSPSKPFDFSERTLVATLHAEGAQVYECLPSASGGRLDWAFREPVATLIDKGTTVGRHFAGPRWALDDGSLVRARVTQTFAGPTPIDIPLLKLDVIENARRGRLGAASEVYRVNTHLGVLQGSCSKLGELRSMPYSADYIFAR